MAIHKSLDGSLVDNVGWIQSTQPVGNLVIAGRCWIDTSSTPYVMKIRNSTNTAWVTVGITLEGLTTDGCLINWVTEGNDMVEYGSRNGTDWIEFRRYTMP